MADIKKLALPVIVTLATIGLIQSTALVQARNVRLYDANARQLQFGRIDADRTTVGQLKRVLSHFLMSEAKNINLITTNSVHLTDDDKLLADYSRPNEVEMVIRIQNRLDNTSKIVFELPKLTKEIILPKDRTLRSLKDIIYSVAISSLDQIVFNGQKLTNYSETLDEYKLYNGAHILVVPDSVLYKLVVRKLDGQFLEFDLTLDTTVLQLKEIIEARENVLAKDQVLVHYDTILDNNEKVSSYSMAPKQGMVVELVERQTEREKPNFNTAQVKASTTSQLESNKEPMPSN